MANVFEKFADSKELYLGVVDEFGERHNIKKFDVGEHDCKQCNCYDQCVAVATKDDLAIKCIFFGALKNEIKSKTDY